MLTICWAAKGGSGTTVAASLLAMSAPAPTLLVDLDGDVSLVIGLPIERVGVVDWLATTAPTDRLERLEQAVDGGLIVLPAGRPWRTAEIRDERWLDLIDWLAEHPHVIVDCGTGAPPRRLLDAADHRLLVTRACYLSLRAAVGGPVPTGIVLIDEPGHPMGPEDIEASLGAPVVVRMSTDPAIAAAVDSGLVTARLPRSLRRRLAAA